MRTPAMVMFKARFHTPEPVPPVTPEPSPNDPQPMPPPIEEERGPQAPVKLPGDSSVPQRV
ncbi:hypothetical protein FN976_27310 [Caenimonas sedimenti]|uniref:Uncharacterized protein n=1 Tax=Caenimonas sedimenti TaxID=2596921 RepID=A0A562ZEP9_9BURK|nr:hypothetical protein [Caenimonas sedimenti]TWO65518.1 hypothetical protein FN976_27310 [Caenimonas sedimenti]